MNWLIKSAGRVLALGAIVFALVGLSGCGTLDNQTNDTTYAGSTTNVIGSPDLLRVGDNVTIIFSDVPDGPAPFLEQIHEDGQISPPMLNGKVVAAGKTVAQLQTELHDLYVPKLFKRLTVTVKSDDRYYFVGGEVRTPSQRAYTGAITVLQAIKAAGDFTDFADRRHVVIIRSNKQQERVDCKKAVKSPQLDKAIYPGDQIIVPRRYI